MVEKSKRVYVKSFGCSANLADGEVIAGCLSEAGFELVEDSEDAEFLVYNTCAVKSPTENRIVDNFWFTTRVRSSLQQKTVL